MANPIASHMDAPAPAPTKRRPRIGPPLLVAALVGGYFVVAALLPVVAGGVYLCNNDFGGIFYPSARFVLAGHPLDMYQVRINIYPNANGPLGEIIIAGVAAIGRYLNLQHVGPLCTYSDVYPAPGDSVALRMWLTLVLAVVPLGIGIEVMRLADRWRRQPFTGWKRLLVWVLILSSLPLWDSMVYYGHFEQELEIWLALLAVRCFSGQRFALSGFLLGLALLNRTAGIFVVIPLALVLLRDLPWDDWWHLIASVGQSDRAVTSMAWRSVSWRRVRDLIFFGIALGGTVVLGVLPFYLHDKSDLIYSLSSFRATEPILDGSIWTFARGTSWESVFQSWDSTSAIILATLISAILVWGGRIRRDEPRLYGVICASVVCFSIGLKAIWGYYFAEPLVWGLIWTLTSRQTRQQWWQIVAIPAFFTLLMILTETRISIAGVPSDLHGAIRAIVLIMSAAEFVALLAFDIVVIIMLMRGRGEPTSASADPAAQRENPATRATEPLPVRSLLV